MNNKLVEKSVNNIKKIKEMRAIRISLLGAALMASATGFSQKTKIVTKMVLDSVVLDNRKFVFLYDERGNNTQSFRKSPYSDNTIVEKYDYTYDDKGFRTSDTGYQWVSSKNEWDKWNEREYIYDDKGIIIEMLQNVYQCGDIMGCRWNFYRYKYTYNDDGKLTRDIICKKDGSQLAKYEYTYDDKGNRTSEISYYRDYPDTNLVESWKYKYTYDDKGNMTECIFYMYDNNEWKEIEEKFEYTAYDSIGNNTKYVRYAWNELYSIWNKFDFECEYIYNFSYSKTDLLLPNIFTGSSEDPHSIDNPLTNYQYNVMVTEKKEYTVYNENRTLYRTNTYYWSAREIEVNDEEEETSIVETQLIASLPKIYPNPTDGQLKITNYELRENTVIEIYSIVGQVVFTSAVSSLSPETTIDINHLSNGLYFLKIDNKMVKIIKN